jgi:hypothetical protein
MLAILWSEPGRRLLTRPGSGRDLGSARSQIPLTDEQLHATTSGTRQFMKNRIRILILTPLCALVWTPGMWAAEQQVPRPGPAVEIIYAVLPLLIIGGVMWWFVRKTQRSPFMRRSIEHYERSEQHMQRMEQIGERIAAALEGKTKM